MILYVLPDDGQSGRPKHIEIINDACDKCCVHSDKDWNSWLHKQRDDDSKFYDNYHVNCGGGSNDDNDCVDFGGGSNDNNDYVDCGSGSDNSLNRALSQKDVTQFCSLFEIYVNLIEFW